MKENILIVLLLLILTATMFQPCCNRYEVVTGSNMLTILVDKKTGETWRNCICGENSNIPGCWEKMITINPEMFNKPIGEARAVLKMVNLQKQQNRAEEQKAPEANPTAPNPEK